MLLKILFKKRITNPCNTDSGLTDCNAIAILRDKQAKLKLAKENTLHKILIKYGINSEDYFYSRLVNEFETLINLLTYNREINFSDFLNNLDTYYKNKLLIKELEKEIKKDKTLLGIE